MSAKVKLAEGTWDQTPVSVSQHPTLSPLAMALFVKIASFIRPGESKELRTGNLAAWFRVSPRKLQGLVSELAETGVLVVERTRTEMGHQGPNRYSWGPVALAGDAVRQTAESAGLDRAPDRTESNPRPHEKHSQTAGNVGGKDLRARPKNQTQEPDVDGPLFGETQTGSGSGKASAGAGGKDFFQEHREGEAGSGHGRDPDTTSIAAGKASADAGPAAPPRTEPRISEMTRAHRDGDDQAVAAMLEAKFDPPLTTAEQITMYGMLANGAHPLAVSNRLAADRRSSVVAESATEKSAGDETAGAASASRSGPIWTRAGLASDKQMLPFVKALGLPTTNPMAQIAALVEERGEDSVRSLVEDWRSGRPTTIHVPQAAEDRATTQEEPCRSTSA